MKVASADDLDAGRREEPRLDRDPVRDEGAVVGRRLEPVDVEVARALAERVQVQVAAPSVLALEGAGHVRPGALQRRHQAEQGAGHDRDAEREPDHVPVETEIERDRRRQREVRGQQQVEQPDRRRRPPRPAD